MPTTDTSTQEEENAQADARVLKLAERVCPECDEGFGYGFVPDVDNPHVEKTACLTCQGTGAKYPQLRRKCWCGSGILYSGHACQGRRWLPVSREKVGTEGRKLLANWPTFLTFELRGNTTSHWYMCITVGVGQKADTFVYDALAEDADNATIAAWAKMEEGEGEG